MRDALAATLDERAYLLDVVAKDGLLEHEHGGIEPRLHGDQHLCVRRQGVPCFPPNVPGGEVKECQVGLRHHEPAQVLALDELQPACGVASDGGPERADDVALVAPVVGQVFIEPGAVVVDCLELVGDPHLARQERYAHLFATLNPGLP